MRTSTVVPHNQERDQRLSAIAQLEQQHKLRRNQFFREASIGNLAKPDAGRASPAASAWFETGKHFLLLVSKGSGNLQQRANQDRAETILKNFSHQIVDGSNPRDLEQRDALFEISKIRGFYPQLFLMEDGVTTSFIGGFDVIEFHNDEGSLQNFLAETPSTPKDKRRSIVGMAKSLFKNKTPNSRMSPRTVATVPLSNRSSPETSSSNRGSLRSSRIDTKALPSLPISSDPATSVTQNAPRRKSSMSSHTASTRAEGSNSMHPTMSARSDGDMPLIPDGEVEPKSERRGRSSSKKKKSSRSKSRGKERSKSKSRKSRNPSRKTGSSRSMGVPELETEGPADDNDAVGEGSSSSLRSKGSSRVASPGRLRRQARRKASRKSAEASEDGDSKPKEEADEEVPQSDGEGAESPSSKKSVLNAKVTSVSRRSRPSSRGRSPSPYGLKSSNHKRTDSNTRRSRSRPMKHSSTASTESLHDETAPARPKSQGQLFSKKEEKSARNRRSRRSASVGRSASPHELRENKAQRSEKTAGTGSNNIPHSPGKHAAKRGVFASKREAMKEFRERQSSSNLMAGSRTASPRKPPKHPSGANLSTSNHSLHSSRRNLTAPVKRLSSETRVREASPDTNEESLKDLVKRVKNDKHQHQQHSPEEKKKDKRKSSLMW